MKAFFILFSTLSTLFLPVMLMGQSVVEKKRANGLVKTRYSIQGKDTLLSEHFYQNGQLSARIWRDDSMHLFTIGEIGRFAKAYKLKKEVDWIQDHYHGNNWDALTRDSTVEYYPDGKMQRRYFWTGDTLFQEQWFATNGQILEVRWWSKKDSMVNRYIGQDPSQWLYSTNRKRDFHQSIQYQNHKLYKKYSYVQNKLAEELFFDTLKSYTKYRLVHRNGQTLLNPSFSAIRMTKQMDSCFCLGSVKSFGAIGAFSWHTGLASGYSSSFVIGHSSLSCNPKSC